MNMKNLVMLTSCMVLSGCAFSHHSWLSRRGSEVSPQQIVQIQPGTTDRQWILSNLGTPDRIQSDKDGLEIFEYISSTTRKVDSDFILLLSWESEKILETTVTRVVLRNGIVESFGTQQT